MNSELTFKAQLSVLRKSTTKKCAARFALRYRLVDQTCQYEMNFQCLGDRLCLHPQRMMTSKADTVSKTLLINS